MKSKPLSERKRCGWPTALWTDAEFDFAFAKLERFKTWFMSRGFDVTGRYFTALEVEIGFEVARYKHTRTIKRREPKE